MSSRRIDLWKVPGLYAPSCSNVGDTVVSDATFCGLRTDWLQIGTPSISPAKRYGLRTAHLRRGTLGYLQAEDPNLKAAADWRINTLLALTQLFSH